MVPSGVPTASLFCAEKNGKKKSRTYSHPREGLLYIVQYTERGRDRPRLARISHHPAGLLRPRAWVAG